MVFVKSDIMCSIKSNKASFLYFAIVLKTVLADKSLKFNFVKIILFKIF